ncbi:hypothetical protein NADFUDRAFT_63512 [Nadsonia fulvescens var. elongata DSM 6958]|uniref:CASTOR ACT domain-containing protein n=1 Tax=Nadsonia fulvescens var. elongata DSM 6958 TaxID=857566 RepID=A0A1E3PRH2_9ASCO|nr:hypothetical protein NADFUDRAFT_63512 [Nadsonia fulvescens var. elongata DSM 6958]
MSTQIQVHSTSLTLISFPIEAYTYFANSIIKVVHRSFEDSSVSALDDSVHSNFSCGNLRSSTASLASSCSLQPSNSSFSSHNQDNNTCVKRRTIPEFITVSITPIETTLICPTELFEELFNDEWFKLVSDLFHVKVIADHYFPIQVDGDGLNDSGSRVLELASPLSIAQVPIFFISTYFSDFILVPLREKDKVLSALKSKNFQLYFDDEFSTISIPLMTDSNTALSNTVKPLGFDSTPSTASVEGKTFPRQNSNDLLPQSAGSNRSPFDLHLNLNLGSGVSIITSSDFPAQTMNQNDSSSLPPFQQVTSDQQAFTLFSKYDVLPKIDTQTKLLITGARDTYDKVNENAINLSILKTLNNPPEYFSLTVSSFSGSSEIAFLIDEETAANQFPRDSLLGSKTDFFIPISFDLTNLPENSTGIVTGVASRLLNQNENIHMSYLSTALTGVVMVAQEDLDDAIMALQEN